MTAEPEAWVDLYWLPLGAGGRSVRLNGRVFEAVAARIARRPPCDLYHTALEVRVPEGRFVIEMTPIPGGNSEERGVVAEGAVGRRRRGRSPKARSAAAGRSGSGSSATRCAAGTRA